MGHHPDTRTLELHYLNTSATLNVVGHLAGERETQSATALANESQTLALTRMTPSQVAKWYSLYYDHVTHAEPIKSTAFRRRQPDPEAQHAFDAIYRDVDVNMLTKDHRTGIFHRVFSDLPIGGSNLDGEYNTFIHRYATR